MSTPTQDILALVRLLLLDSSAIQAKVDDRITGPFSPRSGTEEGEDLYPRIVVEVIGGGVLSSGALQTPIVYVYAYSRTSQGDAQAIFDLVRPVLRMARLSRDGIGSKGSIRETDGAVSGFNPEIGSWFTRGTFQATTTAYSPTE